MSTTPTTQEPASDVTSKEAWAGRAAHTITLESGAVVRIRIPDLTLLLAADAVPEQLKALAIEQILKDAVETPLGAQAALDPAAPAETTSPEAEIEAKQRMFAELAELYHFLVSEMLIEPQLTPAELAYGQPTRPPAEDMNLLIDIARRVRDTDAKGVRLGVMPLSRVATFRDKHGCPEGCEACQAVLDELSTSLRLSL